jgi:hypothetical protein
MAAEASPYLLMLVAQFEMIGMIGLGKLPDPATQKAAVDPERARFAIDMLTALEEKTRGNLIDEEERELRRVLTLLRLNYVEVAARKPHPPDAAPAEGEQHPAGDPAAAPGE